MKTPKSGPGPISESPKKGSSNVIMLHMLTINLESTVAHDQSTKKSARCRRIFTLRYEHIKARLSQRRDFHKGFKF
jgi:hypothetical protein